MVVMKYALSLCLFLLTAVEVRANVVGTSGAIKFDVGMDSTFEATLTQTGLGLGSEAPSANLHVEGIAVISKELSVGGAPLGSANLSIQGSFGMMGVVVTSNITLENNSLFFANSSSSNLFLTLPYAGNVAGRILTVKKAANNNKVFILSSNMLDQTKLLLLDSNLTSLPSATFLSNGQQWYILDNFNTSFPLGDNLIGCYQLNDGGVTQTDASLTNNTGTVANMAAGNLSATGVKGYALDFDGVNDKMTLSYQTAYNLGALSISLWVKTDGVWGTDGGDGGNTATILNQHDSFESRNGFNLKINPSTGFLSVEIKSTSNTNKFEVAGTKDIRNNGWHHIVLLLNKNLGGTIQVYVDGLLDISGTMATSWSTTSSILLGDSLDNWWEEFHGSIDDLRIYSGTLSFERIQLLKNYSPE